MSEIASSVRSSRLLPHAVTPAVLAAGGVLFATAIVLAAVALPLATYTTALATFGLAHVGSELRYVDYRFGGRLRGGLILPLGCGLAAALAVRVAAMAGWLPYGAAIVLELTVVAGMTASTFASMQRFRVVAAGLAAILFISAILAPVPTFLFLAVAHNLTPLAFFADALDGVERRRVLAVMAVPFLALPLLIASGLPHSLLAQVGLVAPEATVFSGGTLADNIGAYIPSGWFDSPWAVNLFSAAVFAQCMHYAVVIFVLPRLIDRETPRATLLRWPNVATFAGVLAVLALALVVGFSVDYGAARKLYALAALVHGWIEIPVLVLALDRNGFRKAPAH